MTSDEWHARTADPAEMLAFLAASGKASERRLRLLAYACCRRLPSVTKSSTPRAVLELAEQVTDDAASRDALDAARSAWLSPLDPHVLGPWRRALSLASRTSRRLTAEEMTYIVADAQRAGHAGRERAAQARSLRDIFGPLPFREVRFDPAILTWNNGSVVKLAQDVYEDRELPSGQFKKERVARLVAALERAGCSDEDVMGHLRQPDAIHVRGCWCVDLLLRKA